jgi:hypothetical protein
MKSGIIAIGGSLLLAGTIVLASRSASQNQSQQETVSNNTKTALNAVSVADSNFVLPQSQAKLPAILVKKNQGDTASSPMRMGRVKMDVKVVGNIATTTLDITYCNELDRILDGQFCFPLGEGQSISYFALEVDGKLREASVVEKAKGRQTYEAVIRRKIDPALLEWTAGNNFRARIYPIPAKGCKRVIVAFEQEMLATGKSYVYYQPMLLTNKLEEFSLHAEVLNQPARPKQFDENGIPMKFESSGQGWSTDRTWTNYNSSQPLTFEVPANGNARTVFMEKAENGNLVFYANVFPKKFNAEKKLPASVCVLWDVSGSSASRDLKHEINLLSAYLKKIKNTRVKLLTFSNDLVSEEDLSVSEGNTVLLSEKLSRLNYDGGTQLGKLDLTKYSCDEFILVSDGLSNFGENEIKTGNKPLHTICSSALSDYSYLKGLAQTTGGRFINLMTTDSASAIEKLSTEEYHFISADYDKGMVSSVYPSSPVSVGKSFAVAGVLEGYKADITLNFGIGTTVLHKEKISLYNDAADYKGIVRKAWAQKKLNELDIFYDRNTDEITSLGKKYGIVTRNTSLLVLDRIEDYIEHKVEPKDPELKKQYLAQVNQTKQNFLEQQRSHLEQVVADFDELKMWYNKDFNTVPIPKAKSVSGNDQVVLNATSVAMDSVSVSGWSNNEVSNGGFENKSVAYEEQETGPGRVLLENGTFSSGRTDGLSQQVAFVPPSLKDDEKQKEGFKNTGTDDLVKGDISLSSWNPSTPYMYELKKVPGAAAYKKYLELKKQYAAQPSFFVDVSDYFVKLQDKKTAMRILSNIAEMDLENHQLLRVLAHRLQELEENKTAIKVYEKILKIREEEPQSYRDLGLAYAQNKEYQKAVDVLCKVVNRQWDGRFPQVEAFVASEINHIVSTSGQKLALDSLDKRLIKAMPVDVRVVINWDSDNCDMDLWVTDPQQEKCFYGYNLTKSGGRISRDFTGGYGPEVFMLKKAAKGTYKVQVNYFGTSNQGLTGPTTVQAELYTNWGRPNEKKKTITLRLDNATEIIDLGNLAFAN